jgi:hypothetical protein
MTTIELTHKLMKARKLQYGGKARAINVQLVNLRGRQEL